MSEILIGYNDIFEEHSLYEYEKDLKKYVDGNKKEKEEVKNSLNKYVIFFRKICDGNLVGKDNNEKINYLENELQKIKLCFRQVKDINKLKRIILEIKKDVYLNFMENIIYGNESDDLKDMDNYFYPEITDNNFNKKIFYKKEFNKNKIPLGKQKRSKEFVLTQTQKFLKNYMSRETPYNGVLIWHGVGVGKTCTAISIAENFKKDMERTNRRILILTPGETLSGTWYNEIFNIEKEKNKKNKEKILNFQCTGNYYTEYYNSLGKYKNKKKLIKRFINEIYEISTYLKQVNMIKKGAKKLSNDLYKTNDKKEIEFIKKKYSNRIIIMDEIHTIKVSETQKNKNKIVPPYLEMIARYSKNSKIILLTATPIFNESTEIVQLINLLIHNDKRAPILLDDVFEKQKKNFVLKKKTDRNPSGEELLIRKMRGYVSYLRGSNPHSFPTRLYPTKNIFSPNWSFGNLVLYRTNMGEKQSKIYKKAILSDKKGNFGKLGINESLFSLGYTSLGYKDRKVLLSGNKKFLTQKKGKKHDIFSYNKKNPNTIKNGYSFLHEKRLYEFSSKYSEIINLIKNSEGTIFIYSDKVMLGVKLFSLILEENGMTRYVGKSSYTNFLQKRNSSRNTFSQKFKYIYVDGSTDNNMVNEWFNDYNNDYQNKLNIKVILGSDKVSQGVNLFRIREVHVLNPWFNLNKLEQVIGRATRQKSHLSLPIDKRNVTVYLHASYDNEFTNSKRSADERNYKISYEKKLNELRLLSIVKKNAIDCNLNKHGNYFKISKENIINSQKNKYEINKGLSCDFLEINHENCQDDFMLKKFTCTPKDFTEKKSINTNTYFGYFAYDEIKKLKDIVKNMFKNNYVYELKNIIKSIKKIEDKENINFEADYIYLALQELINKKELLLDHNNRIGYIIYKNKNYIFQPKEMENEDIPFVYRYYPLMSVKDSVDIPNPKKKQIKKTIVSKKNPKKFLKKKTQKKRMAETTGRTSDKITEIGKNKILSKILNDIKNIADVILDKSKMKNFDLYENISNSKFYDNLEVCFYKTCLGEYMLNRFDLNNTEKIMNKYKEFYGDNENRIKIDFDRYMRYYLIDRLFFEQKKILIEYIINKTYNGTELNNSIELNYSNGEHHIFDYFHQNIGITKKNLFIFIHNDSLYYRLYQITDTRILPRTFKKKGDGFILVKMSSELNSLPKTKIDDVQLLKYCNYYGVVDSGVKNKFQKEEKAKITFKILDTNVDLSSKKGLSWRKGKNCYASGNWIFKGVYNNSKTNVGELTADLISFIFDIPVVRNKSQIDIPHVKIQYKSHLSNIHDMYFYLNKTKYFLFKRKLSDSCLEIECLFRYLRDIHRYAIETIKNVVPQYLFHNYGEKLIQRHLEQGKTFLKTKDHIHGICETIRNIVSNNKYKSIYEPTFYFNEDGICGKADSQFKVIKFRVGSKVDVPLERISGIITKINSDGTLNIKTGEQSNNYSIKDIQIRKSEYYPFVFRYLRTHRVEPCLFN